MGRLPAPFPARPGRVRPEWIDHNGHLNLAYYTVLFDNATDALWLEIGLGEPYRRTGLTTFAVEAHTLYLGELFEGDEDRVRYRHRRGPTPSACTSPMSSAAPAPTAPPHGRS